MISWKVLHDCDDENGDATLWYACNDWREVYICKWGEKDFTVENCTGTCIYKRMKTLRGAQNWAVAHKLNRI